MADELNPDEMIEVREKMQPYLDKIGKVMEGLNLNEALYIGMCLLVTCLSQAKDRELMVKDIHENLDANYQRMMEKLEEQKNQ